MERNSATSQNMREFRRLRAIELFDQGMKAIDIAKVLGVTRGAVSQWLKCRREHGIQALYYHRLPRKSCRLSSEQCGQLLAMLKLGAEEFGFQGKVWTGRRVRDLIEIKFGIKYAIRSVQRLLKRLGWTPQKVSVRASQQSVEEVEKWCGERWPEIKKSRK